MEIESAYEAMISALPFEERELAKDILTSKLYEKHTSSAWWREPILDLGETLQEISAEAKANDGKIRRVNLYCDTLVIPSSYAITLTNESGVRIAIFARDIQYDVSQPFAFSFTMTKLSHIGLYTLTLPENFSALLDFPGGTSHIQALKIEQGSFGVSVEFRNGLTIKQSGPPEGEMLCIDYLHRLNEDGSWKDDDDSYKNENFPRLLYFQFLVATIALQNNHPLALSLLKYVCAATKETKSTAVFNIQASVVLSSLIAQVNTNVSYVPVVNIHSAKQVLKARLLAAQAFEGRFQSFVSQGQETNNWAISAGLLLDASEAAIAEYSFLEAQARKQYQEAEAAYAKALKTFEETQKRLTETSDKFRHGVEKFKTSKEKEAITELVVAYIETVISVGACVLTAGVAAPAVPGALVNGSKAAGKFAEIWKKLKLVFDKLNALYKKMEPAIKKMAKLVEVVRSLIKAAKSMEKLGSVSQMPEKIMPTEGLDLVNGTAEWERMKIDVRTMFDGLQELGNIEGMEEYHQQLNYLPVNGLALLAAQKSVIKTGDQVVVLALKRRLQSEQRKRIQGAQAHIKTDARVLDILKRAMFDRLLVVRSMVFMDFWSYTAAYMYHSLDIIPPIQLSAMKPIHDYVDDAARLHGSLGSLGTRLKIQRKVFMLDTLADFPTVEDLRAHLGSVGSVDFKIGWEDAIFHQFCRIRMRRVRCYLDGVKPKASDSSNLNLSLKILTDESFLDINLHKGQDLENIELVAPRTRSYVGERRALFFEYSLHNGTILCDGEYVSEGEYTTFTPFTGWTVAVTGGAGSLSHEELDFEGLKSVKLEILCDVTLR